MTPEARAARERKQKIFVVVGGLLLLALLAIQLPKLLGGSSSPEAAATTATAAQTPGQPAQAGAAPVALAVPVETGKLTSLSAFERKDPFVQQVVAQNGAEAPAAGSNAAEKASPSDGAKAEKPTTFSTVRPTVAAATIVTVNGARQVLEPGMKFPASDPLFVLVAEKPGSKAVVVGIAGGAYSGGNETTTLKVGKPLTLVNTATGARYRISLVSVGSGAAAEQAAPPP
jgi:hypothetical protein